MIPIGTDIKLAARLLKEGSLVAMPTETVYGLAANASSKEALNKLFEAKGRPKSHPVIVHLASPEQLPDWVVSVPDVAVELAKRFWPGPLTMIFKKRDHVLNEVTGGQDTVAIRIPDHKTALELLREFNGGLAAPSANRFGKLSPTRASDVANEFRDQVAYVLDGGDCRVGIESTIIDVSGNKPRVLRPGMLSAETLGEVIRSIGSSSISASGGSTSAGRKTEGVGDSVANDTAPAIKAPGTLKSHYSPSTPVMLVDTSEIESVLQSLQNDSKKAAVLSFDWTRNNGFSETVPWIQAENDPDSYARDLYGNLRKLDSSNCDWIIVETVPAAVQWDGIRDRLQRASCREE